jgi:3-oxoacyl-(acyl-carrier-protein) synthase III
MTETTKTQAPFLVTIPMPFHGESVVEGVLLGWRVKPGDKVSRGQPLAEIETEKSVWTFDSPCDGEIVELKAGVSEIVAVSAPLLLVRTQDENVRHLIAAADDPPAERSAHPKPEPAPTAVPKAYNAGAGVSGLGRLTPRVKGMLRGQIVSAKELEELRHRQGLAYVTGRHVEGHLNGRGRTAVCHMAGLGVWVPERVVPNTDFRAAFPDASETYIEQVTGIAERRYIADGEGTCDLAERASRAALEKAGIQATDLDMIILATTTPDMPVPATACAVQQRLGASGVPAFDLSAACSGWLYGLSVARQFLQTGACRTVLVIAAEAMSRFTDPTDRATAFLFGDGAGAAVLSSSLPGPVLSDVLMSTDSEGYDIIYRKGGGALEPSSHNGNGYWHMDGKRMYQAAVRMFSDGILRVLARERLTLDDIRWIVPHQANERMWKAVAKQVGVPADRFFSNIRGYGNTSAATIPIALRDLVASGELQAGDRIILAAVGAGLTAASCLVTWA